VPQEAASRLERLRRDGVAVNPSSDLATPLLHITGVPRAEAEHWLKTERRHRDRFLVTLAPGAKQSANRWNTKKIVALGARLIADGRAEVVVVGGPNEAELGRALVGTWGDGISAAGALSPLGSAVLLEHAELAIGFDTGTTHLASAVGTRCVAIYGSREHPGRWDPLGFGHQVLRQDVPCAGCCLRECPLPGHPCMELHTVDDVWTHIEPRLAIMHSSRGA
jgi:heptosyltransferase-2